MIIIFKHRPAVFSLRKEFEEDIGKYRQIQNGFVYNNMNICRLPFKLFLVTF